MNETMWLRSTDWLALWHYARDKEYLTDRKSRLLAIAACRGLVHLVTDLRLLRMVGLAEEWADAHPKDLDDNWWDRLEDWYDEASSAASEVSDSPNRTAAWAFAGLGNDDYKVGRCLESVAAVYGPPLTTSDDPSDCRSIADSIRELIGNPFRPVMFDPEWRTPAAVALARGMYESRDFAHLPILADALDDAGCAGPEVIGHCRGPGPHVRGCWVVDLVLGKT